MADGKDKLLRDDYCDGLGDCLPTCPTGKLAPVNAPYFDGAKLLIAADCTAFAYANLHQEFMKGKRPFPCTQKFETFKKTFKR